MNKEENSNDILSIFKRCSVGGGDIVEEKQKNTENIIYDGGFNTDDKVFKSILTQFLKNKKHIQAVKKIDSGDYTKEYFEENLPHYSSKLHEVLTKCSNKKQHDDNLTLHREEGVFVLDFS